LLRRILRSLTSLQHEFGAKLHGRFVCSNGSFTTRDVLNWQAQRLPAAEASCQNGHSLSRVCPRTVPVGTSWRPVCRVLTGEDDKRLISPLTDKIWDPCIEGSLGAHCWHMNGSFDEPSCSILTPHVNQQSLALSNELLHDSRV